MSKLNNNIIAVAGALCAFLIGGCGSETSTKTTTTSQVTTETKTGTHPHGWLPQDVDTVCTVPLTAFNAWFVGGKAVENGKVMPANSVAFPDNTNCDFYTWSEQMFLWLASPAKGTAYTSGNTVMEDTLFYDVSENVKGKRTMTRHNPGSMISVSSAINLTGPNDLPIVIDDKGQLLEVEVHTERSVLSMTEKGGKQMKKVATIEEGTDPLHHIFKDAQGKGIDHPKAILQHTADQNRIVEQFEIGGKKVFIDTAGDEHTIAVGQATDNVLIAAQNNSIVYYVMMVNDVYAYYITAAKAVPKPPFVKDLFPTTGEERDNICAYARQRGIALSDSNALAMELKLALVEVSGLKDQGSYITIDAMVPNYDTTNKYKWVPKGTRKAKLALIGLHIVGSVKGNPEMIWATFEHKNNAPNGAYDYIDLKKTKVSVPADSGSGWVLCNTTSGVQFNLPYMVNNKLDIDSFAGHAIGASPTMLDDPFGTAKDSSAPNPQVKSTAESNTQVISINNSVLGQLVGNDMRKNYRLIGATWTQGGANPTGTPYSPTNTTHGVAVGTNLLINSTMETYDQTPTGTCFSCHNNSLSPLVFGLSHISKQLVPLPQLPASINKK